MKRRKYDFAGWVTKNDIRCSDGLKIRQGAFQQNGGTRVPLVWNHNYDSPTNVLGHIELENKKGGTYGYGYFNDTDAGNHAKSMVQSGDIQGMSIGARRINRKGNDVVHGHIYEVSLVLTGANPGAVIEQVVKHSGEVSEDEVVIYPNTLIHAFDDVDLNDEEDDVNKGAQNVDGGEKTVEEIIDTLNDEQLLAVSTLLDGIAQLAEEGVEDEEDEDDNKEEPVVKHNLFNSTATNKEVLLTHDDQSVIMQSAINGKVESLQRYLATQMEDPGTILHSVEDVELLFPDPKAISATPTMIHNKYTATETIINGVSKTPFSRIKSTSFDLTTEEARARGYIKGTEKIEQIIKPMKRVTIPTTVYKKQSIDRDDVVDITDFSIVAEINKEMTIKLHEEVARAILVGDGREVEDNSKINEESIRPIISDDDFYTIKKTFASVDKFVESVIKAMPEYRGTGMPTMFIDPTLLADIKLLKGTDGRWLNGHIPTNQELAGQMDMDAIVPSTFLAGKGAIIVNLSDYKVGQTNGGQLTRFEDFDIDFNKHKYLVETRLSGALVEPKSAIYLVQA